MDIINVIFKISSFILKTLGVLAILAAILGLVFPDRNSLRYDPTTHILAVIMLTFIGISLFFLPDIIRRILNYYPSKNP